MFTQEEKSLKEIHNLRNVSDSNIYQIDIVWDKK